MGASKSSNNAEFFFRTVKSRFQVIRIKNFRLECMKWCLVEKFELKGKEKWIRIGYLVKSVINYSDLINHSSQYLMIVPN